MSVPVLGVVGEQAAGLVASLGDRVEARVVAPNGVEDAGVDVWLIRAANVDGARLSALREGEVPAVFVVDPADLKAWTRVLRRGVHDVAWEGADADEVRARVLGLLARRTGWNDVCSALARETAHDLRGPLQALQLTVDALQTGDAIGEAYVEDVDALLDAVDLADLMLDGLAAQGRRAVFETAVVAIDLSGVVRQASARRAYGGRVTVRAGEALPVRAPADVLTTAVSEVVRVVWSRAAGRREVQVQALRLGGSAVVVAQARAYDALLDHVDALTSREQPVLLRRARVPMPLAGLAFARDVARRLGGDVLARRDGQELRVELRVPLA